MPELVVAGDRSESATLSPSSEEKPRVQTHGCKYLFAKTTFSSVGLPANVCDVVDVDVSGGGASS